jgi:hypothetical protein
METGAFVSKVSLLTSQLIELASTGSRLTPICLLIMPFTREDRCNAKK